MTPPTVEQAIAFLEEAGLLAAPPKDFDGPRVLRTIRSDDEATADTLSWISASALRLDPQRAGRFQGALLIAPAETAESTADSRIVRTRNPKLAFSRLVYAFFSQLTTTNWPADESPMDAGTQMGQRVKLSAGVVIGPGCVLGDDVHIGPNSVITHATIGARVRIGANCSIGLPGFGYERDESGTLIRFPHVGSVVIADDVEIGSNTCIDRGALGVTRIGSRTKIDNLVHIAHNVIVGEDCLIIALSMLGGSVTVGARAWISPATSIRNQLTIGEGALVGMGAVVVKSVEAGVTVVGNPAKPL